MSTNDENLTNKPSWGGARANSGRKKGKLNEATKERAKVLQAFRNRVSQNADRLFNAQMNLAEGATMLFKVEKDSKGNDKPAVLVTDEHTIKRFIDECGGYDGTMDNDTYYFLTTKMPDNKAIDSMLDRTFGKAESKLDMTSNGETIGALSAAQAEQLIRARANRSNS